MRLIDADAKELKQRININFGAVTRYIVKSILRDAPTIDAVPVVRCQDCLHYKEKDLFGRIAYECEEYETDTGADGYCHKGVRREDGGPADA